ncbi:hypothetical protein RI129_011983 [Pyrocoelia pectoralis]|uniref:Uncharacterized protein n=1 Tax=Pyrocoelia pectoralis TaxID=417401 RepID=A0AAN7V5V6_9COLE
MSTEEVNEQKSNRNQRQTLESGMEYQGVKKKILTPKSTTSTANNGLKYFYNSWCKKEGFTNYTGDFKFRSSVESEVIKRFGNNSIVVLSSQNYRPCRRSSYGNILEIYDVEKETKSEKVLDIYGAFSTDIVWITDDNALVMFESEEEANMAVRIRTNFFKSRKLLHGSEQAIKFAVYLRYPKDKYMDGPDTS